ncbi:MAG: sterol desaturase family protein, partial [Planctomycetota bacterium]
MKYFTAIISALFFGTLLLTEQIAPLRNRKRPFLQRFFLNMTLSAVVFLAGSVAVRSTALLTSKWATDNGFGILPLLSLPKWTRVAVGILLMDLTFYYWHRANHRFPLLWRFHNMHHIDPDMDVSTSFRFHFVEILYSTAFRFLQILLLGVAPLTYVVYETIFACCTMFHHSNVRLPLRFERLLNKAIVTPRMHGIHHSAVRNETNSNYSVVFRCWDW